MAPIAESPLCSSGLSDQRRSYHPPSFLHHEKPSTCAVIWEYRNQGAGMPMRSSFRGGVGPRDDIVIGWPWWYQMTLRDIKIGLVKGTYKLVDIPQRHPASLNPESGGLSPLWVTWPLRIRKVLLIKKPRICQIMVGWWFTSIELRITYDKIEMWFPESKSPRSRSTKLKWYL